jgi:hypothetical protein
MTKAEVTARLKEIDLKEYGQEDSNTWQRDHAKIVEQFINEPSEEIDLIAQALYGLQDLQVRDYAMGILDKDNPTHKHAICLLIKYSPAKYAKPAKTFQALHTWELGNGAIAHNMLIKIKDYPLATLLVRSILAGWPASAIGLMRQELHPKVMEKIFGELVNA